MMLFYITFQSLLIDGLTYINKILELGDVNNSKKHNFYKGPKDGILDLKSQFTEQELEYIKYRRHCICHIFQDDYEYGVKKNGEIKDKIGNKHLDDLTRELLSVLAKHEGEDARFDTYLIKKLYPKIDDLYKKLNP